MMKKKAFAGICLTGVLSLALLAGCGQSQSANPQAPAGDAAKPASETLVMSTNATFPPFEFVDTANGTKEIKGLDIDIANTIAKNLGVNITINDMAFAGIIGSIMEKRADFAISGMSPTPERLKNVDFSDAYFYPRNAIVAPKGANITALDQLVGKKIAVPFGTTYEKDAKTVKDANVVALDGSPAVIQELNNKRVDAAILDGSEAYEFLKKNPGLEMHLMPKSEDSFAIAFPKGSKWVEPFNKELKKMQESGELNKLIVKWLGEEFQQ
ncbi:UNVERIFIED_CONTAM: ABC-type amino acid transport substrate-binding protein [Brevibacillus sp. OAP136]